MKKRIFSPAEKYAIWHCHGRRCWLCFEPLRLKDTTVDHFFPESLLTDDARRMEILREYGLGDDFDINSFMNWLPCHNHCNQIKGDRTLGFVPGYMLILQQLIKLAPKVQQTANTISSNARKDELFGKLFAALESEALTIDDLRQLMETLGEKPAPPPIPEDILLLEGGYWVHRKDVAREGECKCERNCCVGSTRKVYCYFRSDLSSWVITSGLYWKCYDEVVQCPRCSVQHKRGHIGKEGVCKRPFHNQEMQTD